MKLLLVDIDRQPRANLVGIVDTLFRALTKIVLRVVGNQKNAACGNLKLCAGF